MSGRRIYLNIRHKVCRLLNPALCQVCGVGIAAGQYYCDNCRSVLTVVPNPCQLCGQVNYTAGQICPACLIKPPRWQTMIAPWIYAHSIRSQIHQLKFDQRIELAHAMVGQIAAYFGQRPLDALIPVPLHRTRFIERGFNQSQEIAAALSRQLSIPLDLRSLQRIRPTQPQSGLSPHKRRQNIRQAFEYHARHPYQAVAIVDDVITSGSTMHEICSLLRRHHIAHIEVWSLARALKDH